MKILILILCLLFVTCEKNTPENFDRANPIVAIGHGVYYFRLIGTEFGIELAKFKTSHKIISVVSDNRGTYGHNIGFFVICDEQ